MRYIDEVIVHCSATRAEWWADRSNEEIKAEFTRWHVEDRGWAGLGYNSLIFRDGEILPGRDLDKDGDSFDDIGAHVKGRNARSIGVVLVGGFGSSENDRFDEHFTLEQDVALRRHLAELQRRFPTIKKISGHNQYAAKACPGFNVPRWLANKPEKMLTQSKAVNASNVGTISAIGAGAVGLLNEQNFEHLNLTPVLLMFLFIALAAFVFLRHDRIKKWNKGVK